MGCIQALQMPQENTRKEDQKLLLKLIIISLKLQFYAGFEY